MSSLEIAEELTSTSRQKEYGHPLDNFKNAADILRVLVRARYGPDIEFTPDFIGLIMAVAIKGSRAANAPKPDTIIDGVGYYRTMEMCFEEQQRRENEQRDNIRIDGTESFHDDGRNPRSY